MSYHSLSLEEMYASPYPKDAYKYVSFLLLRYQELNVWLTENLQDNDWYAESYDQRGDYKDWNYYVNMLYTLTFHFRNEDDMVMFKLKFGS